MHIFIKKSDAGFSLLEVMVAMSIIAIAFTAALGLQSRGLSLADEAKFYTTASMLAQRKIAEIESENIENIIAYSGDFGNDFPGYNWEFIIENSMSSKVATADFLKQINLKISWSDDEKYQYHLRLYSFIPAKG